MPDENLYPDDPNLADNQSGTDSGIGSESDADRTSEVGSNERTNERTYGEVGSARGNSHGSERARPRTETPRAATEQPGLDRICALDGCRTPFSVRYPSQKQRFCSRSCASRSHATRPGSSNPNWRGGMTWHPLYATYLDMIARCQRSSHPAFARYGGRGITVCERWRNDFWAFVADMGERPGQMSLDRVDNDGPYAPENCRWATASEQSKNRRPSAYAGLDRDPTTGRWKARA